MSRKTPLIRQQMKNSKELMNKAFELAYDITTLTKHDVFARFSAHIQELELDIHFNGWEADQSPHKTLEFNAEDENLELNQKLINYLESIKAGQIKSVKEFGLYECSMFRTLREITEDECA